jgi:hypothetical protein
MRSSEESKVPITDDACGHQSRERCPSLPMHAVVRAEKGGAIQTTDGKDEVIRPATNYFKDIRGNPQRLRKG